MGERRGLRPYRHLGQVEPLGGDALPSLRLGDDRLQPVRLLLQLLPGRPERSSGLAAPVGVQAAEEGVDRGEGRAFAEHLALGRGEGSGGRGRFGEAAAPISEGAFDGGQDFVQPGGGARLGGHASCSLSRSRTGSVNRNVDPLPRVDSACSSPPCASTRPLLIHSPSPEPVGRPTARRKNLVNTLGRSDGGMPSPRSRTHTDTLDSPTVPSMRRSRGEAYLQAFSTRLVSTCSILSGSAYTLGNESGKSVLASNSGYSIATFSTTLDARRGRSTICRRRMSLPVSRRLMSSSSVMRRVTRSASWLTCSSIIFFWSSGRRSQRLSIRLV